jgi:hypothetical protein
MRDSVRPTPERFAESTEFDYSNCGFETATKCTVSKIRDRRLGILAA